jgi:Glycosyltransferase (GlcNAc)
VIRQIPTAKISELTPLDGRIFVSIAAYRDPELVPTVADCLEKARHPERLRFRVCWQHGEDERLPAWFSGEQFSIIDLNWRESRGVCWARALLMDLWDGESWYLQLDSHHRFVRDWDVGLLEQISATGSRKPVLTTYATPYAPGVVPALPAKATAIAFWRFTEEGDFLARATDATDSGDPVRARFVSAHFLFAPGTFVEEVPYDPQLYFTGEEATLGLRAFTHGYDLFHPGIPIVAHEYTRDYRIKHWDDHVDERGAGVAWHDRDAISRARVRRFLAEPFVGYYGLGRERSFADYESYAGLSFSDRRIQRYTQLGLEPPNPADGDWVEAAELDELAAA